MTTVSVHTEWPSGVPARSGLPPRNSLARILDAQAIYLSASRRYSIYVPLSRGYDDQITRTEIPDSDPEEIKLRIPSWTTHLRWGVVSERDASDATVTVQRSGEAGSHTLSCPGPGGDYLPAAALYLSDGPGDSAPVHIEAGNDSDGWTTITVSVWLAGDAEVYGVVFEAIAQDTITA